MEGTFTYIQDVSKIVTYYRKEYRHKYKESRKFIRIEGIVQIKQFTKEYFQHGEKIRRIIYQYIKMHELKCDKFSVNNIYL